MRRSAILVASHLVCLLAGAWATRELAVGPTTSQSASKHAKSGERNPQASLAVQGEDLARQAVKDAKSPLFSADEAAAIANGLTSAADAEKKVRDLTGDGTTPPPETAEFAGALLAWFRTDPSAAISFLKKAGMTPFYDAILKQALAEMSPRDHLKFALAGRSDGIFNFHLVQTVGKRLSELDTAEAAALIEEFKLSAEGNQSLRGLLQGWPAEDPQGFLDLALAVNSLEMIQGYLWSSGSPRKSSAMLMLLESRTDLPSHIADFLAEQKELRGHLYRYADPSVPLDERIAQMRNLAWLRDATPEALREGALKQISTVDINEMMKTGPDYRFAFRHGAMSADEVLAAVKAEFPELASASDYETRVRVYNELASEDAQGAYALIAHLPEEQRNLAVIHQARWSFRDNSPDTFFSMINLAPGPDSSEAAPQREDAWNAYGSSAYREYGDDYVQWVRELPSGTNRDVARSTLAKLLEKGGKPLLAAEFAKP